MTGVDAIRTALLSTQYLTNWFIADLSDADLLVRPVGGANHIAWQLGHVIAAEQNLMKSQLPDTPYPALPTGFAEKHTKETSALEPATGFLSKAEYQELFRSTREATVELLDKLSDADLDRPTTGNMAAFAPTLGAFFVLVANHSLMHGGQFSVVRRKLGKPVLF